MLRLKHILSILFLVMATAVLAEETYVIDSVCVGAERTYRRDGEAGYTYDWYIRDTLGTNVANPSGIDFSDVITPGDTTWGSEITYQWIDTGIFDIVVEVYTEHGCDTLEQGRVKVYPEPEVEVGEDQTVCALENIIVSGDAARNYSVMFWETSGDGSFSDDEQLHPTYYLGPNDSLAGSVTLTITAWGKADNITCEPAVDSITYFFSNPEIELAVDDVLCFGDSTASVTATVTNGISPYNYSWTGPDGFTASTADISALKTGEYILTVIDANGCEDTDTAWINEPTELLLSVDSIHDVSCYGYNDGFLDASAIGGTPPYQFDLSGFSESGSNVNFNGLSAGKYELILTDANGCVVTDSVEVNEPDELIANIDTINSVQCYGSNNGSAHVSVIGGTGPFSYEWNTLPVQNSAWAVDLEPGTYSVIITDENGCQAFDTVNITEPDPLVLTADSIDVRCGGKKPGSIDLHVSGGTPYATEPYYRYEWQDTTGTVFATTEDIENLEGDQLYTVWVTDSLGCVEMHQVYINEIKNVELTAVVDSAKCYGDLWTIDVTATKGKQPYEFVWTDSSGINVISNDEDLVDVPAGIYIVTVYDRDSCNETMNFVLEEPEELLTELYPDNDTICETEITRIQADPNGGTGAYTHLWTGSGAAFLDRTDTTVVYFGTAPPNNYQLIYTLTDENLCAVSDTINIMVLPLLVDTLYASICANQLPYDWNGNLLDSAGLYMDTIAGQIGFGCDTIKVLSLEIGPLDTVIIDTLLCYGDLTSDWNGYEISSIVDSSYKASLKNTFGCDSLVTLNVEILPVTYSFIDTTIFDSETPFAWNGNSYDTTGIYIDTTTNTVGCDSIMTLDLEILYGTESETWDSICENELPYEWNGEYYDTTGTYFVVLPNANAAGADSTAYIYLTVWETTYGTLDTAICEPDMPLAYRGKEYNAAGTYTDTLVNENGCDSILTITLNVWPVEETFETLDICDSDLPYSWQTLTLDSAGTYRDTLLTRHGCDSILVLALNVNSGVAFDSTIYACESYVWDWGDGNTYTSSGIYEVITGGANGCGDTLRLDLIISPALSVSFATEDVSCYGDSDGSIMVAVLGGIPPYSYEWDNGAVANDLDNIPAGKYVITIKDSLGCTVTDSAFVNEPDSISITIDLITDLSKYHAGDGSVEVSVDGGTPAYSFVWKDDLDSIVGTNEDLFNQSAGTYTLLVTDANNCTSTITVTINEPEPEQRMDCQPNVELLCFEELAVYPLATTLQEYVDQLAPSEEVYSDCGLDLSTFTASDSIVESSEYCHEEIRYYSIIDSCGEVLTCEQRVIVNDTIPPTIVCPPNDTLENSTPPLPFTLEEFIAAGGDTLDNCGVVSFDLVNEQIIGTFELEIRRTYEIADYCGKTAQCTHTIFIDNTNDLVINCPPVEQLCPETTLPEAYDNLNDFIAAGGSVDYHVSPIDSTSFVLVDESSDGESCPEVITRIYAISNEAGQTATCEQQFILNDTKAPLFVLRNKDYYFDNRQCNRIPTRDQLIYKNIKDLRDRGIDEPGRGEILDDNCAYDMRYLPDESSESSGICPKVYTHVYEVYDRCGNTTKQTEVITIYDIVPPEVANPDPIYSDCNKPKPYNSIEEFMLEGGVTANELYDCNEPLTMNHVRDTKINNNTWERIYLFEDVCLNKSYATQLIYLNDIPATDIDTAVCEGAPAIEWNGTTIPATMANNGLVESVTLTNAANCDSIINLHVTVWPITYGEPEEWLVCFDPSKDSIWNGQTITFDADRTYTDTLPNATNGCDSIASLTVNILPTASHSDSMTICYNSPAFTWNEIPVSTTVDSAYTAHFATSDGCDSVVTLNVEILPIDFVEIDTTLCEGPFEFMFGTNPVSTSYADSGAVYTAVFTNQFGCDSTVELTVHIIPTVIGHEYWEYCQDEPPLVWNGDSVIFDQSRTYTATIPRENECDSVAILHVTVFEPVEKYIPNTFCEGYPTIPKWGEQIISPTQDSLYQKVIKGGSSHGCDSIAYLDVKVIPTSYSYDTLYLCEGDPDYIWNSYTIPADPVISGTDYNKLLQKQSEDGCDSIANLHVLIVYPVFGVDTMEVCYGAGPIDWYGGQVISTTNDDVYIHTIEDGSRYGCDSTVTLTVIVVDDIMPEFAITGEVCLNSTAPALPDTSINGVTGSWNPAVISTGSLGSTTYVFTPDDGQCALEYTVEVKVVDEVIPQFDLVEKICQFSIAPKLPGKSLNGVSGTWSPDTILTDVVAITTFTFTPDDLDCAQQATLAIEITPEIVLSEDIDNHVDVEYSPNAIGQIDLIIDGGTGNFDISWTGPNGFTSSSGDLSGLEAGEYSVEVIDEIGCSDTLTVVITSEKPVLTCPPDTIFECPDPSVYPAFKNINDFIAGGGYVEPLSAVTFFDSYDEVDPNGSYCLTILRTYIVGDSYGNLDSCTQRIEFYDNKPPLVAAPAGGSAECLSSFIPNIESLEDFLPYGTVSDNCALDSASFTVDKRIVRTQNSSEVTYIFSIRDVCGNLGSDSAVYVLSDTIPPDAVCNSITVHLDSSGNYVLTDIDMTNISAGSSDNCTAFEDLEINVTPSEFTCEDVESGRQVHVEVIDEAGNVGECWANIVVVDELPPVALCQDITVYLNAAGEAEITVNMIDAGSYDNCELESLQISRDHFDCTDVGNNIVRLIATDVYGNVDSCEAVVTVIDEIPPYITCIPGDTIQLSEEDGTFALTWEYVTDSVWDECGIDTVLLDRYLLDCNNIGQTTITATAYDVNGNTNSCTTEFIVIGNTPPNVQNDSAITAVNIPVDINVVQNDYDLKTNINISTLGVTVGARNGSVEVDNTTGIATYTPNPGYVGTDIFMYSICDDGIPCTPECGEAIVFITVRPANLPPVAVDDYFDVPCISLSGNVAMNDYDPDLDDYVVDPVPITSPTNGTLVLYEDGHFEYEPFIDFTEGIDSFQYQIWDEPLVGPSLYDTAWVYITRVADNDCDGVADVDDIDDDNDGIRDNIENGGYWPEDPDAILIDSDQDGIPDYLDIDSDNDGIVDNIEGQDEHNYIEPDGWRDDNNNGWDDRYDDEEGGYAFDLNLTDTDGDGIPDYLDSDSDNDNVPDYIEGSDDNADGIPDYVRFYSDLDRDGLDDAYDWVDGWGIPNLVDNETGSIAPLQDFDGDGWRDWRDVNDEDDEYLTKDEDINGNGDYSDDDLDLDGHPEYLDTEMECELFIPEGFSPNDDGVHDFFQILCIYPRYPDAKMMIFNRNGQLIWQKEKYGNYDYWGWDDAWWWGTSDNKFTLGRSGGLPAGNYIYVLELNDGRGTVHNGTVMIAY